MIDITNPEHLKALNHACVCAQASNDPDYCEKLADMTKGSLRSAFVALSDPAQAADLIRQLVERAGVPCVDDLESRDIFPCAVAEHFGDNVRIEWWAGEFDDEPADAELVAQAQWTTIIARLLSVPPSAGAEAVLRALRGEG